MIKQAVFLSVTTCLSISLSGCLQGGTTIVDESLNTNTEWTWQLPPNFPTPVVPADNPMSEAKFQLGRRLFYDKRLSVNQALSCASCHHQDKAFTDGNPTATGALGDKLPRNVLSIVNSAYHATYTWVNPEVTTLEVQIEDPLFATKIVEMGINDQNKAEILQRFRDDLEYINRFKAVFPDDAEPIQYQNIIKAISAFERGVMTGQSKYEKYQKGLMTLSESEQRGRDLFNSEKAECFHCHGSFNFNDQVNFVGIRPEPNAFHNTGLYNIGGTGAFPSDNLGLIEFTHQQRDMGLFRANSLWNVAVTAPYMHDGSMATLEEVIDFYSRGGRKISTGPYAGDGLYSPYQSDLIVPINFTEQEKSDLIAFLNTLTDEDLLVNERYSNPFK